MVVVRVSDEEHRAFLDRAMDLGLSVSAWARSILKADAAGRLTMAPKVVGLPNQPTPKEPPCD